MPERVRDRPLSAIGALIHLIQDPYWEDVSVSGGTAPSRSRLGNGAARKRRGSVRAWIGEGVDR